ncbi:ribonuclease MC-like [Corylus avellana]|uniref:ribonuclease MC-like n=1 Tax=Corylus avellana TaxID=13451 RepID=UPI00286B38AE|nr:ribonuclease MC-like [Corylus avellana]
MKVFFVFFVFLFCLPPIVLGAFDFYLLSLQWPPGYCYQSNSTYNQCKQPFPMSFTIHGLWPQNYSHSLPLPCPQAPPFNLNEVTSDPQLFQNMNALWPNLLRVKNSIFWGNEWTKHGTCTTFTQHDYFQTTCGLALSLNQLLGELQNNGMSPGRSYPLNDYKATIESAYNVTPLIACNRHFQSRAVQMFEIRFCVDPTANDFINCAWTVSKSCGSSSSSPIAFTM